MAHIKFMRIKQQTCPKKEEKIRLQMIEWLVYGFWNNKILAGQL
jgi:hypothetical protein